jgi:zinc/manganese transport system substrate-binding protein
LTGTLVGLVACGDAGDAGGAPADRPHVVVTTSILGDIVSEVVGDQAEVEVVMPLGTDPHEFQTSARQVQAMVEADLLVINGAGFEEGMLDAIENAEESGTPRFAFADHVDLIAGDPHIWTDPTRMITAVEAFGERAAELDGVDAQAVESRAAAYLADLRALDAETERTLAAIPADRRILVTNHEVFGYFADRYGFEIVGAVIPSLTTNAEASAADLAELADVVSAEDVPAIFAETTRSTQLADTLAEAVGGDVAVVELFTESLGAPGSGAETYLDMMRTNAGLVADALS